MRNFKTKRLLAILTAIMLLAPIPSAAFAADENASNYPSDPKEYQIWKDGLKPQEYGASGIIAPLAVVGNLMYNAYIEAYVGSNGRFTMGTTEGNPNISTDNNALLLYGHPSPWSSETLVRVDGVDTFFDASSVTFNGEGTQSVAKGNIGDVEVTQTLTFENNPYTARPDVMSIRYTLTNKGTSSKQIGARIMLDTMLGWNDGAPFRVPGIGDVISEIELAGSAIPEYWQAFDNLTTPNVVATGTFYRATEERPDKVQFAAWPGIYTSSWDYIVTPGRDVTGDSAVAAYFNPRTVPAGQSRSVVTYYGISDFSTADLTPPLSLRVTSPSLLTGAGSGGYANNPFAVTAYVGNIGNATGNNVRARISLPPELQLEGSSQNTITIGDIAVGTERFARWTVRALPQTSQKNLSFTITITADNAETKTITVPLNLGAISAPDRYRTVTFDLNGAAGTPPPVQQVLIGNRPVKPVNPTRPGYAFKGWYANRQGIGLEWFSIFNITDVVTANVTLYAKWQKDNVSTSDLYNFDNISSNFRDKYYISTEYYNILTSGLTISQIRNIGYERDEKWNGAANGMGVSESLFANGLLTPGYFFPGAISANTINTVPKQDTRIESLINYYQLAQYLPAISRDQTSSVSGKSQKDLIEKMVSDARAAETTGDFAYISIAKYRPGAVVRDGGHLVVGFKVTTESNGDYRVHLFESNDKTLTDSYFIVKSDYSNAVYHCAWASGDETWNGINTTDSTLRIIGLQDRNGITPGNLQDALISRGNTVAPFSIFSLEDAAAEPDELTTNYIQFAISNGNDEANVNGDSQEGDLQFYSATVNGNGMRNRYHYESSDKYIVSPASVSGYSGDYRTSVMFGETTYASAVVSSNNTVRFEGAGSIEVMAKDGQNVNISLETTINDSLYAWESTGVEAENTDLKLVPEQDFVTISSTKPLGTMTIFAIRGDNEYSVTLETTETAVKVVSKTVGDIDGLVVLNSADEVLASVGLTYSVDFYTHGGSIVPSIYVVEYDSTIAKPEDPSWQGFVFGGWYKDSACEDGQEWDFEVDTVKVDTILHAKWITDENYIHKVTFRSEGYDDIIVLVQHGEDLIDVPPVPEKPGKIGQWDISDFTNITADLTVNALYEDNASVATFVKVHSSARGSIRLRQTLDLNWDTDASAYQFISSNPNIASVDQNGRVTALKSGTAVITLKALDDSALSSSTMLSVTP
ncbi:MAG: InlB B-repeat-containing protein [Clostridiales Family XIII bacterium]|nr:InlB B-repeat-containing protein [Clostridiales Family XIII bacterium]